MIRKIHITTILLVLFCVFFHKIPNSIAEDLTYRASDDAMQIGTTYRDASYYDFRFGNYVTIVRGSEDRMCGFLFKGVEIPQGAVIEKATLTFNKLENNNRDTKILVFGELSASPEPFSTAGTNLSSRQPTSASVTWGSDRGDLGTTPGDITGIISEITSLSDWTSGNSLVLLTDRLSSSRNAEYYAYSADFSRESYRPLLTIIYSETNLSEIDVDRTSIGVSSYIGYSPSPGSFTLSEIGKQTDFIGEISITINDAATWLSVSPSSFTASSPLLAGGSREITLNYDADGLSAGAYDATITISGNAKNEETINVTLLVKDVPASASCGEIPLYAQNVVNPAIMVELDTSGSMAGAMPILASGENPRSSSLKEIVQEIVNRPALIIVDTTESEEEDESTETIGGWQAGHDMAFVLSGTNTIWDQYRSAYSYDGQPLGAPRLSITYLDESGAEVEVEYQISHPENDVQEYKSQLVTDYNEVVLGVKGAPVGLLFEDVDVPNGATIVDAELQFVISQKTSDTCEITIQGVDLDTAPPFTSLDQLSENLTTASATWDIESWGNTMPRIDIAEDVLAEVFEDRSISWGFATWDGGRCSEDDIPPTENWTRFIVGIHEHDSDHQDYLQAHVYDGTPGSCTPLAPALDAGYDYFTGTRSDKTYGTNYSVIECQPKIVVMVTDGIGNSATTMELVEARVNQLLENDISVVAVGFGINNDEAKQIDRIAELAQAAGDKNDEDLLYGLHKVNSDGVGVPYLAQSREDFIKAMTSIVSSVKAQIFYGSAPAATTSTDNGEVLLNASYSAADWTGEVTARKFNIYTGALEETPIWTASESMPSAINGFIYDTTTSSVITYSDASLTGDNFLCKPLGDIINSTPIIVGKPSYWYRFNNYFSYKYDADVTGRKALAYVTANDGALHAFNLSTGVEEWRFYPEAVQAKMNLMDSDPSSDMCSSSYCHKFLFDGSPQAADVYDGSNWKTVLLAGLGRGGSAYVAFDVTYGNDFDATENPSSLLWEFTDTTLGYTTSYPEIERVADTVNKKDASWIVLFGSGEMGTAIEQSSQEAYLYGINIFDKSAMWLDSSSAAISKVKLAPSTLAPDVAASPVAVDIDDDYLNDIVYISNRYGNMYRVSNIGEGEVPEVATFFYSNNSDQPATTKPGYALASDDDTVKDVWVYFGTGSYEVTVDKFNKNQQYFYGLFDDEGASENSSNTESATYTPSDLYEFKTDIVKGYAVDSNGRVDLNGDGTINSNDMSEYRTVTCTSPVDGECNPSNLSWKLALWTSSESASERVVTQPLVVAGVVFFATFIPDDDPCEGDGKSYLFAVDYQSGSFTSDAVFDINEDGTYSSDDQQIDVPGDGGETTLVGPIAGIPIGDGKPTDLELHNDILYAGTTNTPVKPIKVNLPGLRPRLKAWRQMIND